MTKNFDDEGLRRQWLFSSIAAQQRREWDRLFRVSKEEGEARNMTRGGGLYRVGTEDVQEENDTAQRSVLLGHAMKKPRLRTRHTCAEKERDHRQWEKRGKKGADLGFGTERKRRRAKAWLAHAQRKAMGR